MRRTGGTIRWFEFDRSRTGWVINWFVMFPFFLACWLTALVIGGIAVWCNPGHAKITTLAAILVVFALPLWSCIRHGK